MNLPAPSPSPGDAATAPSRRRELWAWVALTALGCVLVLFAASRAWVTDVRVVGAPAGGGDVVTPTGGDLGPVLTPVALAGLAGVVAALAAKGAGRAVIGVLIAVCGLAAGLGTWLAAGSAAPLSWLREHNVLHGTGSLEWDPVVLWPVVSGAGAALMVAGGVVAVLRGRGWAGMSDRYERAGERAPVADDRALWDALDRGDDPT
ncbi:Trp biosynthesis-associated membrane protein [Nonomuraea sp. NPDC048916]|uniref:Trp biosynthesis-associated membrane protein n=1 Tax=Nonomuraea sp. NPDC048916 TaxID=3154232 RepID=UPI0033C844BE